MAIAERNPLAVAEVNPTRAAAFARYLDAELLEGATDTTTLVHW
jgi:hypothetical protein